MREIQTKAPSPLPCVLNYSTEKKLTWKVSQNGFVSVHNSENLQLLKETSLGGSPSLQVTVQYLTQRLWRFFAVSLSWIPVFCFFFVLLIFFFQVDIDWIEFTFRRHVCFSWLTFLQISGSASWIKNNENSYTGCFGIFAWPEKYATEQLFPQDETWIW